jgi:hypothetical protein
VIKTLLAAFARFAAAERLKDAAGRFALAAVCGAVAAVFVFAAIGCAAAALWLYLLPCVGPVYAPLIVAGALLAIALACVLGAVYILRRKRRRPVSGADLAALLAAAEPVLKEHKTTILVAALVAGLVVGSSKRKS